MMALSALTTCSVDWYKPRHVAIDDGHLVATGDETTYPLLEAAHEGRALRACIDARTDDEVCEFTQNWGFLHLRVVGGRKLDRFPLALFRLHQQYFLALARLIAAVRSRAHDLQEIRAALIALKAGKTEHEELLYQRPAERTLEDILTKSEEALADQGVPPFVLLSLRGEHDHTIGLMEYAAQTLASELSVGQLRHLQVAKNSTRKRRGAMMFDEVPVVYSLEQVMRWTIKSRFKVLRHFFCESCGRESISWRADARFCKPECGTLMT